MPESHRRDFLTGRAAGAELAHAGDAVADELTKNYAAQPIAGNTIRVSTSAMACEFAVLLNPGPPEHTMAASDSLELAHDLEQQMSVYRGDSEMSVINRIASDGPVEVEPELLQLLRDAVRISLETDGAFDPTSGPLIALWRACRSEGRIPTEDELAKCLERTGTAHIQFDETAGTIAYDHTDVELNLGGIGKGYALDRIGGYLSENGLRDWLIHGGHSSMLARGRHASNEGWPVGLRNPLFPKERLGTVHLKDRALASSGLAEQHFRYRGRRYGHILDPRTGHSAEGLLAVTVLAPQAALADALSTAFFVLGLENALGYCDNHREVSAVLVPHPKKGRTLEPVCRGFSRDEIHIEQPTE